MLRFHHITCLLARNSYSGNGRLSIILYLNFGTFWARSSLDLMEYILLMDGVIISWMQVGVFLPWSPLKTINSVLNSIWYLTGSQWSVTSSEIMRSYFLKLKTSLAAVFCTCWGFLIGFLWYSIHHTVAIVNLAYNKCMYNRARGFLAQ